VTGNRTVVRHEDARSLDQLYGDVLAEGGKLVSYAGGDTATWQYGAKAARDQH
jgi:hypothetical protein